MSARNAATPAAAGKKAPVAAVEAIPADASDAAAVPPRRDEWPLFEVFVRARRGVSHNHVGSINAPDARMALTHARDLYASRQDGPSIWVVPSSAITANSPDEKASFFEPAADKIYRHPTFYDVPEGVQM